MLQAQIRGYLARQKFKRMMSERNLVANKPSKVVKQTSDELSNNSINNNSSQSRINYDLLLKSVKTIQSHWRGYSMRKLYRDLRLDIATKAMQFGYFCEQVCIILFSFLF